MPPWKFQGGIGVSGNRDLLDAAMAWVVKLSNKLGGLESKQGQLVPAGVGVLDGHLDHIPVLQTKA